MVVVDFLLYMFNKITKSFSKSNFKDFLNYMESEKGMKENS